MPAFFDSRDPAYRAPCGALPAGGNLHLRVCLPRFMRCDAALFCVREDAASSPSDSSMFWCGMCGDDYEWWECDYQPPAPGLYWYHFLLHSAQGWQPLARGERGKGRPGAGDDYQLTVYEKDFETPGWLCGGVMYQIFPDRFYASGKSKSGVPEDRLVRDDWGGQPEWRPDEHGEITNRDYFGGDLDGIRSKLDYLKGLGVTCLYLNPIFEAHSNHRYNTADYCKIDPLLGDEEAFAALCREAHACGMRVILDGVFNHTGSDSVYFNREGRYPGPGAFQSQASPYSDWYRFSQWPGHYASWWGFPTLPQLEGDSPSFRRFLLEEGGVARRWLRLGADGWRLDVADELSDRLLEDLRSAVKAEKPDALLLGEVWEDASNKMSYGRRRRYLLGGQLDSVMNYPFREAVLGFVAGGSAEQADEWIGGILEHYPPQAIHILMNHIGTHDTARALTVLAGEAPAGRGRAWQAAQRLTPEQRGRGLSLLRLAALMQYTLPGVPCLYYGDEAGMEGYADPFNRGCYPWGEEEEALLAWYRQLGGIRARCGCLKTGGFETLCARGNLYAYLRRGEEGALLCALNPGNEAATLPLPSGWEHAEVLLGSEPGDASLTLPPLGSALLYKNS